MKGLAMEDFGIVYGHLVNFTAIWYMYFLAIWYILWLLGKFLPFWYFASKNPATLEPSASHR
jgi:hypothetical protein